MPGALAKTKNPSRSISRHKLHHQFAQSASRSVKIWCNNFHVTAQSPVMCLRFIAGHALPLSFVRFLRLANRSSKNRRSPARRSRNGRESSGKTSGEMSRPIRTFAGQLPGSGKCNAAKCPRERLARQLASWRATWHAMSASQSTQQPMQHPAKHRARRLTEISPSPFKV